MLLNIQPTCCCISIVLVNFVDTLYSDGTKMQYLIRKIQRWKLYDIFTYFPRKGKENCCGH